MYAKLSWKSLRIFCKFYGNSQNQIMIISLIKSEFLFKQFQKEFMRLSKIFEFVN